MSRITGVTLMLIVLIDNFSHSAASRAKPSASKVYIRKCGCQVFPDGKIKCRYPLLPANHVKKQDLLKCLCSKTNQHKLPEFQAACRSWQPNFLNLPL